MAGEPQDPKPNWEAFTELKSDLLSEFREDRVNRVEYVVAFMAPFEFTVWLGTSTDAERDSLASSPGLGDRVRGAADGRGLAWLVRGVIVESKETVDREYEGSWFYRVR